MVILNLKKVVIVDGHDWVCPGAVYKNHIEHFLVIKQANLIHNFLLEYKDKIYSIRLSKDIFLYQANGSTYRQRMDYLADLHPCCQHFFSICHHSSTRPGQFQNHQGRFRF